MTVSVVSSNGSSVSRSPIGSAVVIIPAEPDARWHAAGSTVTLTAVAAGGERFLGWTGDGVPAGQLLALQIDVAVTEARHIIANFGNTPPDNDGDGMPDFWEDRYGLDNSRDDSQEDRSTCVYICVVEISE